MIRNPLTNRMVRVGGRTYSSIISELGPKMGGALMVDQEYEYMGNDFPRRRVTLGQRRIRNKSLLSSNLTTYKGAQRSLKGRYLKRPSPPLSATLFTPGTRRRGNDGNMWEISVTRRGVHRWVRSS